MRYQITEALTGRVEVVQFQEMAGFVDYLQEHYHDIAVMITAAPPESTKAPEPPKARSAAETVAMLVDALADHAENEYSEEGTIDALAAGRAYLESIGAEPRYDAMPGESRFVLPEPDEWDGGSCPECGSGDLDGSSWDLDGRLASQRISCLSCDATWVTVYGFDPERSRRTLYRPSPTPQAPAESTALWVDRPELNTMLAALRYYQAHGMGEPENREDWLQEIACPGPDDTSLSGEEIGALCERLNLGDPEAPAESAEWLPAIGSYWRWKEAEHKGVDATFTVCSLEYVEAKPCATVKFSSGGLALRPVAEIRQHAYQIKI